MLDAARLPFIAERLRISRIVACVDKIGQTYTWYVLARVGHSVRGVPAQALLILSTTT